MMTAGEKMIKTMSAMKKISYIILALCATLACTKEKPVETGLPQVPMTFTAVADGDLTTRTSLDTEDWGIVWSSSDRITVFAGGNDAAGAEFSVSRTYRDGREAIFIGSSEKEAGEYFALSPAQSGATISGGVISATLPSAQTAVAGSFGPESALSVAKSTDKNFEFKNVGALIGITAGNTGLTGLRIEALGSGDVLSGPVTIDYNDGEPSFTKGAGDNYVEISGTIANGSTYYFSVLPGTYASGFRVTLIKGGEYATFTKSASTTIGRNDILDLGSFTGTNWKTAGAAEAGQKVVYVGASGYWNPSESHYSDNGDTYNYEIFTSLTAGQPFYFAAAGGEKFSINAAGTAVSRIARSADAAYSVSAAGIYRIRLNLPSGDAHVKQISRFVYSHYGVLGADMEYVGEGVWSYHGIPLRYSNGSHNNRYKFNIHFADGDNQYYGRMNASGNPTYGTTAPSYFYVQPCNDTDSWEPGFKFPSMYEQDLDRYYADVTLYMNNAKDHYTHEITNIWDKQNPLAAGEAVRIYGDGAAEASQQMRYSTSFYNSAVANSGDRVDNSPTMADPVGYDYEIFTRLTAGEKFYFSTESGHHFAINSAGTHIEGIIQASQAAYTGVGADGVYRIRINSSTNEVALRRAESVRYLQPDRGTNQELTYIGNGVWRGCPVFGWTHPQAWGNSERFKFKFQIYFNETSTWQYYGRYETESTYTSRHIQPITDTSTLSSWNNFLTVEGDPDLGKAEYQVEYGYCDMYLKLNVEGYTYEISNIRQ